MLASALSKGLFASSKEKAADVATFEVVGATAKERALNSAKELAKQFPGASITVMAPTGSLGNMAPFGKAWEDFTGVPVNFFEGGYGMDYVSRISQETMMFPRAASTLSEGAPQLATRCFDAGKLGPWKK